MIMGGGCVLDPLKVIDKIKEEKTDDLVELFADDYKAMIETVNDIFKHNGYILKVEKIN